ncbi:MAG: LPS export ABC transporter permease LptG [Ideonella sp.]|nr:LPS export ABC transporter permease LptG [Ideonella sp.]MBL0147914.1 LPS export ABC transporter permease LptG [Ideonella sp.]
MKTVRRLLYRDILWSVAFVAIAFLSLFFFIDFVDELDEVGREGYTLWHAAARTLLALPGHFYELFPITVLIGAIYAMARLAQSSEFTILRTAGLGPGRALWLLAIPGLVFALLTFVVGDYVSPFAERKAVLVKAGLRGGIALGLSGAWLKDRRQAGTDQERSISVNVAAANSSGELRGIRIFEFDRDGRLRTRIEAAKAQVGGDGTWHLLAARLTEWPTPEAARLGTGLLAQDLAQTDWRSTLDAGVVAAALLPVQTMTTLDLWRYSSHLSDQDQAAQRHEIQFWKKALYPLACVVMMGLALPFAYMHARTGGVSFKVFGGIMLGISFMLLNNVAGHLGLLRQWTPWMVAAAPSALYLLLSMAAFGWLVRYR